MNEVLGEGDWVGEENFQKVKVLEDRIKRLEKENKTLLHKVFQYGATNVQPKSTRPPFLLLHQILLLHQSLP